MRTKNVREAIAILTAVSLAIFNVAPIAAAATASVSHEQAPGGAAQPTKSVTTERPAVVQQPDVSQERPATTTNFAMGSSALIKAVKEVSTPAKMPGGKVIEPPKTTNPVKTPGGQASDPGVLAAVQPIVDALKKIPTGPTDQEFTGALKAQYNITFDAKIPIPMDVKKGVLAALAMFPNILVRDIKMSYGPTNSIYAVDSLLGGREMRFNSNVLGAFKGTAQEREAFARYVLAHELWHIIIMGNVVITPQEREQLKSLGQSGSKDSTQLPSQYAANNMWEYMAEVGARVVFAQNPSKNPPLQAAPRQDLLTWLQRDNGKTDQCRQTALILMSILARAAGSNSIQTFDRYGVGIRVPVKMNGINITELNWRGRVFSYRMRIR